MGVVTSEFAKNDKSAEALTAQNTVLNKQIKEQRKKLDALKEGLAQSADKYGENDTVTQKWQQTVNSATAELNKMERQLDDNNKALDDAGKKSEDAWGKLKTSLAAVGDVAGKALAALGAAAVGAAAAIGGMALKAGYAADDLNTMAKVTGLSTEQIQKFQFASEQIDVSLDTLTGSMTRLTKNMGTAQNGTGDAAKAFAALGISITDSNGELRDGQQVFNEVINALSKMENETQRDAYAMQILGKSAKDLNPLILGGAETLEELGKQAENAGLILSQDSLDSLNLISDAVDTFKATVKGTGNLFSVSLAAPIASAVDTATGYIQRLTGAFSKGGFGVLSEEVGGIISDVITDLNSALPQIVEFGTNIIGKIVEGLSGNLPLLMEGATDVIAMLTESLIELLPEIIAMGLEIVVQLAQGIAEAIPDLIPVMVDAMLTIVDTLIENIDMLIDAAIAIITALATGIMDAMPRLIEKVPEIITKLVTALIENLPKILAMGVDILLELGKGLILAIPQLLKSIPEIITSIKDAFTENAKKFWEIGKNIVHGIWEGIKSMANWIGEKVGGFFSGLVDGVKSALGINSPSKVFAQIGNYMAQGLGVGFEKEMAHVQELMRQSIPTSFEGPSLGTASQDIINGVAGAMQASQVSGGRVVYEIVFNVGKTEFVRKILDPLYAENDRRNLATT